MQSQNYTITSVKDTGWDKDPYGNSTYNVTLEGVAEPVLRKTPKVPEVGSQIYGHLEPTKSGSGGMWFKPDKKDNDYNGTQVSNNVANAKPAVQQAVLGKPSQPDSKNAEIIWSICIKEAATFVTGAMQGNGESEQWADAIQDAANALYSRVQAPGKAQKHQDYAPTADEVLDEGEPVDLAPIPF